MTGGDSLADRPLSRPHADRLSPDDPAYGPIIAAHDRALRSGAETYVDPGSGLVVLTAGYLARRRRVLRFGVPALPLCRLITGALGMCPVCSRRHSATGETVTA